ncbi:transmembrane ascorbate-dependent reductase CYB561-like [Oscarella lobularis]|uniref:transmembrane ascorbate-dependent reductase CYB561-like n=1 Tax=Oscarella lobularis TaxID=121494 RepID=UPI003313EF90
MKRDDAGERVYVPIWLFTLYELASALPTVLIVYWTWSYRGGLAWNGSEQHFNWHPVLMVTGLIYFTSQSLLAFRLLPCSKATKKALHVLLHLCSGTCAVIGLVAVLEFHRRNGHSDFHSLHSWCGLITLALFTLQFLLGFCAFLFPGFRMERRTSFRPIHSVLGLGVFSLAIVTSLIGINEKIQFINLASHEDEEMSLENVLANSVGLIILFIFCLVFAILSRKRYKALSQRQGELLLP